jgi:lipoprotein
LDFLKTTTVIKVKLFSTVFLLYVTTHALISCEVEHNTDNSISDTELDYNLKGEGQITVTDANGSILYNRTLSDAGYKIASLGSDVPPTLYLRAKFKNEGTPDETQSFLVNNNRISEIYLDYTLEGRLQLGVIPTHIGHVSINHFSKDKHGYYNWDDERGHFNGEVTITSFEANRYITVAFKNCKCNVKGATGNRFSGTIKFPLRK